MATVFLANDLKHDRAVAIKVLHPELAASIGSERFEREIRVAAKLQHPHILGLFDSGQADGLLYYVMPFVQGESLREWLDRQGQLPLEDALQIALEVADALAHAHARGVVHRDIKPENILIANGHALVADFGIATAASEGAAAKLTQTGVAVGTPVYMAPEQAAGGTVGPTADLYSLGCVLYEMLAGEPPFTGKNPHAIMARHALETVPSVRIVRSSVPQEVEDAIFAAMGKVPADRPQTASQFTELLGAPLGSTAARRALGRTATRRVPTLATTTYETEPGRPAWLRWPWVGLAAVALLGIGGFGIWRLSAGSASLPAGSVVGGLDPHRIAVLYFDDLSRDKRYGFAADGLTEALIGSLAGVLGLSVISKGGVEPFRDSKLAPDSIARALTAGTVVSGDVEARGDQLEVTLRLHDGASGAVLERAAFKQPAEDLLAVRDSLAAEAARLVRKRLGEEIRLKEQRQSTSSVAAWSLHQRAEQARKLAEKAALGGDTTTMNKQFSAADSLFGEVERSDPKWVDPIVARASVAYRRSRLAVQDPVALRQWVGRGLDTAERALRLDPDDPSALAIRGELRYWSWLIGLEPDAGKARTLLLNARQDLETATRINPAQANAWATLSHLHYQSGTLADVNIAAQRAWEADAFLNNADLILGRLFISDYDLGQFNKAEHWCDETRRRFPDTYNAPRCQLYLLTTRIRDPDVTRAWQLADSVAVLAPRSRKTYWRLNSNMLVAAVAARARLADSARRIVSASKGDADIDPSRDLALFGAFAYVLLGDKPEAIDLLKVYLAANERRRQSFVEDPGWWFRDLAGEEAFKRLIGPAQ